MGRSPRIDVDDAWHHVTNRGAGRRNIFRSGDIDRLLFEELLSSQLDQRSIDIHAYCLMGNHFHLLVHCPEAGLSEAMRRFSSTFTRRTNSLAGADGPMFRSRFYSKVLRNAEQIAVVSRYIHRNPLELGKDIREYRWSSYAAYLGTRDAPDWLRTDRILAEFGGSSFRYAGFVGDELAQAA